MKAFLINPIERNITEVEYSGDYKQIYKLIDAECFDVARINTKGDGIFVDDEGLFKENQKFFVHKDYPSPLAGKGLVLGCDHDGESVEPQAVTLEDLIRDVIFVVPVSINGEVLLISADELDAVPAA